MKTFDLSAYYLLFQAFEATGTAMFGNAWSGQEIRTGPSANKQSALKAELAVLEARLLTLEVEHQEIKSVDASLFSDGERDRRSARLNEIYDEQNTLRQEIVQFPNLRNMCLEDEERYERRSQVQAELRTAFEIGALHLIAGHGFTVDWRTWSKAEGFHFDFYLSSISVPASVTNPYTAPALIIREDFNVWVKRFSGNPETPLELTPEAQLEIFLLEQFKADPSANIPRSEIERSAQAKIEGLTQRGFAAVWRTVAPEIRKQAGRKRKADV